MLVASRAPQDHPLAAPDREHGAGRLRGGTLLPSGTSSSAATWR
ncbi:hypothetical protein [Streptomyces sp. NPDC003032]